MSEARPHLVALPDAPAPVRLPSARRRRRTTWLLFALAVVCAIGWAVAERRSERLARDLVAVRGDLDAVRARLAVLEAQRSEVHSRVEALSAEASALTGHLSELEHVVGAQPHAADAQLPRTEPAPAD